MKNKYEHITEMENIMLRQQKAVGKLEEILKQIDSCQKDYEALIEYYYSEQRDKDIEDRENHLLPEEMECGVLSEDEVYDLFLDTREAALHMMESALKILRVN